jgi:hypothetical protein
VIAVLYSERETREVDGPFMTLLDAVESALWETVGVCLWVEVYEPGLGWVYENVKWCGDHWLVTSRGCMPIPPFRPHFIEQVCM